MQPKIIISKNKGTRDKAIWDILRESDITKTNSDLLLLEDEKTGIAQIKQLIKHLSTKPFGNTAKSVVILEGSNISPDAQNALLKTLEETPGDSIILIGADSEDRFLPTVLSRCLILNYESGIMNQESKFDLSQILNSSIEERFEIVEKSADKEQLLNDLTEGYRKKVLMGEGSGEFLDELLQAQIWKQSNVNIRTILEYLMLKLSK